VEQVGYTLTLHNQLEAANIDRQLLELTDGLKRLTQDTVDDSATVKIITFVSAVYLPGSFIAVSNCLVCPEYCSLMPVVDPFRDEFLPVRPNYKTAGSFSRFLDLHRSLATPHLHHRCYICLDLVP
jgi:hypothetical protein